MKANGWAFILICLLWVVGIVGQAQTATPLITSFTTTATAVGRDALMNRTARIPVAWSTVNRPIGANLVFEQILPVGGIVNVELPRLINYVASEGTGIAAPVMPPSNDWTREAERILLRVSLVSILTGTVYDFQLIELPIVSGNVGASNIGTVPRISTFTAQYDAPLDPQLYANGIALLPVRWSVQNRPITANLVFEQVLLDRRVVNVELPRPWTWVNSSDSGMVAAVVNGAQNTNILLSIRLVDMLNGRTYDQRLILVPTQFRPNQSANITHFSTDTLLVSVADIQAGQALIPVTWSVTDRPQNSNLVFEQVMPDGTFRNAELPRSVPMVPSSGNGVVNAILPVDSNALVYRLRLIDLATQATLATAQLIVTIEGTAPSTTEIEVTGDACFRAPFPASTGLKMGEEARIERFSNGAGVTLYQESTMQTQVGEIPTGATIMINSQPVCMRPDGATMYSRRLWQVSYSGMTGWLQEYGGALDYGIIYFVRSTENVPLTSPEIVSFSVTPEQANSINETVTITWETRNASRLYMMIYGMNANWDSIAPSGSITIALSDYAIVSNPIIFELNASDMQLNNASEQRPVAIMSNVVINQFSVTPTTGQGNSTVAFDWDIQGSFLRAEIQWVPSSYRPSWTTLTAITTNTGSYRFTLPDNVVGTYEMTLSVTDGAGITQTQTTSLTITCAYTWGIAVEEDKCPLNPVQTLGAAYQPFERGAMLWLGTSPAQIWVLSHDGTASYRTDAWDGLAYSLETPPDGLRMPERGFGYVWTTELGVRDRLGWATQPEQSYNATYQQTLSPARYDPYRWYITAPDGRLIQITGTYGGGLTWRSIN